jgi:hypothetical protein
MAISLVQNVMLLVSGTEIFGARLGFIVISRATLFAFFIRQTLNIVTCFFMTGLTTEEIQQCFWRGIHFVSSFYIASAVKSSVSTITSEIISSRNPVFRLSQEILFLRLLLALLKVRLRSH